MSRFFDEDCTYVGKKGDFDAKCAVRYDGTKKTFDEFILIGFEQDDVDDNGIPTYKHTALTSTNIFNLIDAEYVMQKLVKRSVEAISDPELKELVTDYMMRALTYGIQEKEDDDLDDLL